MGVLTSNQLNRLSNVHGKPCLLETKAKPFLVLKTFQTKWLGVFYNTFFTNIVLFQVDLRHMCEVEGSNVVDLGIDLSEFYMSVEWDILEVPAVRWDNIV